MAGQLTMNIREGIIQAIAANAALTVIVGERVTSSFAPESTPADLTWIVMTLINGNEEGQHDGDGNLTHPLFQLTVGGPDKADVDEACRLLKAFNCTEFTYTEGAVDWVLTFLHSDDRDEDWSPETRCFKSSVDLEVWAKNRNE